DDVHRGIRGRDRDPRQHLGLVRAQRALVPPISEWARLGSHRGQRIGAVVRVGSECRVDSWTALRVTAPRPIPPGRKRSKGNQALPGARRVFSFAPAMPPAVFGIIVSTST